MGVVLYIWNLSGKNSFHKKIKPKAIVTHVASSKSKIENDKTPINNNMEEILQNLACLPN